MSWHLHQFRDSGTLISALCEHVAGVLARAVSNYGRASLVVSGGTTPVPLFRALADTDLPWAEIVISLADERWVDETHPDSNAALVRRELLHGYASTARFVSMKCAATDAFDAESKVSRLLASSIFPIDMLLLGMGEDGHTASLFPKARGLAAALNPDSALVCHGIQVPGMSYTRMTLGLGVILRARKRVIHIQGENKYKRLQQAMQAGPAEEMPIRAVLHAPALDTEIFYSP